MLGDKEVEIINGISVNKHISCNGGSVTADQWMEWYNIVKYFYSEKQETSYFDCLKLGEYETQSTGNNNITVGCIKKVTLEQIEAITERIKQ